MYTYIFFVLRYSCYQNGFDEAQISCCACNFATVHDFYTSRSRKTGLTIVLARAESPIVNGYFCLATEADDHDGLPHTLEHLVFLGSEDYPYKEVLDLLANRCLADRTNAWTDTDHTCYTVYTAGLPKIPLLS